MIQIDTGLGLTFLSIAITFRAWFNGGQTKKLLKEWRDEDVRWRQEQQKTLVDMQKHHDETIKYIANLISAKTDEIKEEIRKQT